MRHFVVIAGTPGDVYITADRIENYFRSAYSSPIVKRHSIGNESQSHTLILAASDEALLPKLYLDNAAGCWIITLGAWFFAKDQDLELEKSIKDVCFATDILAHPVFHGLDAAYCIASGMSHQQQFSIITDRIGTQHVYAQEIGSTSVVSTSNLALAAVSEARWNMTGVQEFLATGSIFGTRTLFDGIAKLSGATKTTFVAGKPPISEPYWSILDSQSSFQPGSAMERLGGALEASIYLATQRLGTPSLSLTGGLDSRIVFAAALNVGAPFETFTMGEPDHPDVVIAKKIAAQFGIKHRNLPFLPASTPVDWNTVRTSVLLSDGGSDALRYTTTLRANKWLSKHADFSLTGSGGEFCKGYWWELLWPAIGKAEPLDIGKIIDKRFLFNDWSSHILAPGSQLNLRQSLIDTVKEANKALDQCPNTMQLDNVYLKLRMQCWQGSISSATDQIWPGLSPFMFKEPMEIAFSLAAEQRIRNRMSRQLNEHLNPVLAKMPIDSRGPALPLRIGTALRFLPAVWTMLEKVVGRVREKIPDSRPGYASQRKMASTDHYEGLSQFRDSASWQTSQFYEDQKLAGFVRKYFEGQLPIDRRFGRIVTLEAVARHLDGKLG